MVRQNWQIWTSAISDDVISEIEKIAGDTSTATTFNDGGSDLRSSRVAWLKEKWVLDMLFDFVDAANQNAFHTSIYKKADMQFTEYHATENGHYDMHHDIDWNKEGSNADRKLSVTVQLSDPEEYEGGFFGFAETESPHTDIAMPKGTVLVFPSYLQHAVSPVTSGVRKSLVAWFEGPKWR